LGSGALAVLLLWSNTGFFLSPQKIAFLQWPRRLWEDTGIAVRDLLTREYPGDAEAREGTGADPSWWSCRTLVKRGVAEEGIRPFQFWRTIPLKPFRSIEGDLDRVSVEGDAGRARLLSLGFRLLDGVAPFLGLWIGVLFGAPLVAWAAWELGRSGWPWAGVAYGVGVACSAFAVGCLTLPHSTVGFYLASAILASALAAYACLAAPTPVGLLWRSLVAGLFLAVGVACRSGTVLLLPGIGLALGIGARRQPARRLLVFSGSLLLVVLPTLAGPHRAPRNLWVGLWEGLGDFDRTKGHFWLDQRAKLAQRAGGVGGDLMTPESEAFFRQSTLHDIGADPVWYATILAKRLAATLTQSRLWGWGGGSPPGGDAPGEGATELYYTMVPTADRFVAGPWALGVPIGLLLLPTLVLGALGVLRWPGLPAAWGVLLCLVVAVLPLPVFVSTGGIETQVLVLVYLLAAAFLLEAVVRRALGTRRRPLEDSVEGAGHPRGTF
jgi:hypothetical protein